MKKSLLALLSFSLISSGFCRQSENPDANLPLKRSAIEHAESSAKIDWREVERLLHGSTAKPVFHALEIRKSNNGEDRILTGNLHYGDEQPKEKTELIETSSILYLEGSLFTGVVSEVEVYTEGPQKPTAISYTDSRGEPAIAITDMQDNLTRESISCYKDGKLNGKRIVLCLTRNLKIKEEGYHSGLPSGIWYSWDSQVNLINRQVFNKAPNRQ